ncbi:MAG: class I SAM-dependent methyltransferase [Chloroflexota bacterium]
MLQFWTHLQKRRALQRRYQSGDTPWDTGIVPPEITALIEDEGLQAGRVLDLGCGTGTNLIYLAQHGWEGIGVDLIKIPVEKARQKAGQANVAESLTFYNGDVLKLASLGVRGRFTLITDIGCGHNLPNSKLPEYIAQIANHLADHGIFMWYVHCPTDGREFGISPERVKELITPHFEMQTSSIGDDIAAQSASAWYHLTKKPRS